MRQTPFSVIDGEPWDLVAWVFFRAQRSHVFRPPSNWLSRRDRRPRTRTSLIPPSSAHSTISTSTPESCYLFLPHSTSGSTVYDRFAASSLLGCSALGVSVPSTPGVATAPLRRDAGQSAPALILAAGPYPTSNRNCAPQPGARQPNF